MKRTTIYRKPMGKNLFDDFRSALDSKGLSFNEGKITDAMFVETPKQKNVRYAARTSMLAGLRKVVIAIFVIVLFTPGCTRKDKGVKELPAKADCIIDESDSCSDSNDRKTIAISSYVTDYGDSRLFPIRLKPELSGLKENADVEIHGWCGPMALTDSLKHRIEAFAQHAPKWIVIKISDWDGLNWEDYDHSQLLGNNYRFLQSDIDAIRDYMYVNTNFYNYYCARYRHEHYGGAPLPW